MNKKLKVPSGDVNKLGAVAKKQAPVASKAVTKAR